jgi:GAF domain-containing protein
MVLTSAMWNGGQVDLPAGVIAEAARAAVTRASPAESLRLVIEMTVRNGPCDSASITMLGPGRSVETVASSDDRVPAADQLQYTLGEGPCLDAVWTDGIFLIEDLTADGRWPAWAPGAAELGIRSSLSVHLFTDTTLGSLNMYSTAARSYSRGDIDTARVIAAHVSVVMAYNRTNQNLWQAIDSRNLIGQAQGMLMERFRLTAATAFGVLRRYSQHHNVKLIRLAEELTTTGKLPDLDPTEPR